ncbi:cytochrome p450 [Moniliophthora roreri MCA 2997]|uniref:Cytochrome p450 n=1 Tax=Moniliophthora roreri (strain MCA 2997) TaxID=1381753 RepID=V2WWH1_MONRO|nr:cytochrome p450 [Moniliophthora roreri MCA 2997]
MSTALASLLFPLLAWLLFKALRIGRRERFLPPGPPTVPILGNMHVFPTESPHLKFTEWAHEYGEIYSLKIGSSTIIVISSMEAAKELMDKRSSITSDRPKNHMVDKITNGLSLVCCRYSDTWRVLRKAAHAALTSKAVESHLPIQKAEATQVMHDLVKDPGGFFEHLGRYSNSVMISVLFGKRCPRYESHESRAFYQVEAMWNRALSPAVPPVDILPFLDHIPERWAWWKGLAKEVRRRQRELYFGLLDECEERMKRGEENGSYMEQVLSGRDESVGLDREMIGYLGGSLLEGGSDTTTSFLRNLVLLLTAFPRAQQKAQEEIDRVVGRDRIPTLADIKDLPYVQALIKEIHRFRPVLPLVIPHTTLADEEYLGYLIPQGTIIFVNSHAIYRSSEYFDDPDAFYPERYLVTLYGTKPGADASSFRDNLAFGYGRRVCPGIHLAENSLNLNTMNLIWAFDFEPVKDSAGNEIPVSLENYEKKGMLPSPLPFKCQIRPRYQNVIGIIEREFKEATDTFVKFERDLAPADKKWVDEIRGRL